MILNVRSSTESMDGLRLRVFECRVERISVLDDLFFGASIFVGGGERYVLHLIWILGY